MPTPATSDISVVIPYCNREQYIDEAIQSVLAQTLQPLEIIIVNDCSRESSRRYLDRYAGVCSIVDLPVNIGLAAARNEGIRRARGQFIAFWMTTTSGCLKSWNGSASTWPSTPAATPSTVRYGPSSRTSRTVSSLVTGLIQRLWRMF